MTHLQERDYPIYDRKKLGTGRLTTEPQPIDTIRADSLSSAQQQAQEKHGSDALAYHRKLKPGDAIIER